jgi:DNA-binding transcriptional LysR family regulator
MREQMDRLEAMSILVAAVEAGSFSAASRKLGVPLPTVSRKVAELEARLNTRLLVRSTRKLALTDAGVAYVAACKRILEQVGDAETEASGEYVTPKGDLVIAAPIVFGRLHVLPTVSDFLASFPDINVRMVLSDRNVNLVDDHVDMAVRIGALPDSSMIATRVGSVRPRRLWQPALLHGTWYTEDAGRPCGPQVRYLRRFGVGNALDVRIARAKPGSTGATSVPSQCQHRGSCHRRGNCRGRDHPCALLPSCACR